MQLHLHTQYNRRLPNAEISETVHIHLCHVFHLRLLRTILLVLFHQEGHEAIGVPFLPTTHGLHHGKGNVHLGANHQGLEHHQLYT